MCLFYIYMGVIKLYLLKGYPLTILNRGLLFLFRVKMILEEGASCASRSRIIWYHAQNTVCKIQEINEYGQGLGRAENIVILGAKSQFCVTHTCMHTHACARTHVYRRTPRAYAYGGERGQGWIEPFLFLQDSPYSSFLDLIFLTHIICFVFFLEEISQDVCNLYSRYIYFVMLSVSFLSKENNFKILCQLQF